MKLFIPAWHYRARAVVQRTWGWSPIEELVLLSIDQEPATMPGIAVRLSMPLQVVRATIARLMQFGLIELRVSPTPAFASSAIGKSLFRAGRALPERTTEREVHISLVLEKVGHSVLRRKEVTLVPTHGFTFNGQVIGFPPGELPETDDSMVHRITQFVPLRPGEWLRGVRTTSSVIERKYLEIDLQAFNQGRIPEGASPKLVSALRSTVRTSKLPIATDVTPQRVLPIKTTFKPEQLVVGSIAHLDRFEEIVGTARSDVFVLSTFVTGQDDLRGRDQRERVYKALEAAVVRGVTLHLFYGSSIEPEKHARHMQELIERMTSLIGAKISVSAQRESVNTHAKFVVADDGADGVTALVGSCNWLSSPFAAVEVSVLFSEPRATAATLDVLSGILVALPTTSRSVQTLQFWAAGLRRQADVPRHRSEDVIDAALTVLRADEHQRLLRHAAHGAKERFVCITNRLGANAVPALLNPAEVAGGRLDDVRIYYSRQTKPMKRSHVNAHKARLMGVLKIIPVKEPQVHAKFLAWDRDNVVISTLNWGSQTGTSEAPWDEVGFHIHGEGIADILLELFDRELNDVMPRPQTINPSENDKLTRQ
jgi:hypothetical protein